MKAAPVVALDSEFLVRGGFPNVTVVGFSFAWVKDKKLCSAYVPINHEVEENGVWVRDKQQIAPDVLRDGLQELIRQPGTQNTIQTASGLKLQTDRKRIIVHNAQAELQSMHLLGVDTDHINLWDTMIASWILETDRECGHGLKGLTKHFFDYVMHELPEFCPFEYIEDRTKPPLKSGKNKGKYRVKKTGTLLVQRAPLSVMQKYATEDAEFTYRLYRMFQPMLIQEKMEDLLLDLFMEIMQYLTEMQEYGMPIDKAFLEKMAIDLQAQAKLLEPDIFALRKGKHQGEPFNIGSSKQLNVILFDELGIEPKGKPGKSGQFSTKADYMKLYALDGHEICKKISEHSKLEHLASMIQGWLKLAIKHPDGTWRLHGSFNLHTVRTGRLSSSSPNQQNVPTRDKRFPIRKGYVAPPGRRIVDADYEQIEIKVWAHLCLHRSMMVSAPDGAQFIGDIVAKTQTLPVFTFDTATKKKLVRNVTAHFKNGAPYAVAPFRGTLSPKDWLIVSHEGDPRRKLVITPQHQVYTPTGKRMVGDLTRGDYLLFEEPHIQGAAEQVVLGCLLGDGGFKCVKTRPDGQHFSSIEFYHGEAQKAYFDFKREILGALVFSTSKEDDLHRGRIAASFQVEKLRSQFCEKRTGSKAKRPTIKVLQQLDVRGLAIWYLDDGSLNKDVRCVETKGFSASIASLRITAKEVAFINKHFGLYFNVWKRGFGCSGENAQQFLECIAEYVPPCMEYKLPPHFRGRFRPELWSGSVPEVTPVRILSIKRGTARTLPRNWGSKFDIMVEDTHNYFAQGILVSNSGDEVMIQTINNGGDLHAEMAEKAYHLKVPSTLSLKEKSKYVKEKFNDKRSRAKNVNFCVPLSAQALTRTGWKAHDEVQVGDEVLGFDGENLRWTPVRHVHHQKQAQFMRLNHSRFNVTCTPQHTWVVNKSHWPHDRFEMVATKDLTDDCRILLSAPIASDEFVPEEARKFSRHLTSTVTPVRRQYISEPGPAWCLSTDLGSWVMRQNGFIMLTGNSVMNAIGPDSLAIKYDIPLDEGKRLLQAHPKIFPQAHAFLRRQERFAEKYGYVRTLLRRKRHIPESQIDPNQFERGSQQGRLAWAKKASGGRKARSSSIQGGAGDIILIAMRNIRRFFKVKAQWYNFVTNPDATVIPAAQVHDEVLFYVEDVAIDRVLKRVVELMGSAVKLKVPTGASAEWGNNWYESKCDHVEARVIRKKSGRRVHICTGCGRRRVEEPREITT